MSYAGSVGKATGGASKGTKALAARITADTGGFQKGMKEVGKSSKAAGTQIKTSADQGQKIMELLKKKTDEASASILNLGVSAITTSGPMALFTEWMTGAIEMGFVLLVDAAMYMSVVFNTIVVPALNLVITTLQTLRNITKGTATSIRNDLICGLSGIKDDVTTTCTEISGAFLVGMTGIATDIVTGNWGGIPGVFQTMMTTIEGDVIGGLSAIAATLLTVNVGGLSTAFTTLGTSLVGDLTAGIGNIGADLLSGNFAAIPGAIQTTMTNVEVTLYTSLMNIKGMFGGMLGNVWNDFITGATGALSAFGNFINGVKDKVTGTADSFKKWLGSLIS